MWMKNRRGDVKARLYDGLRRAYAFCVIVLWMAYLVACSGTPASTKTSDGMSNIGVVDTQQLVERTKLGRQVADSLNDFMKDRQAILDLEQKELRKLEDEMIRQAAVLSESAKKQREEQFRRRMLDYQQKVSNFNREVQEKQTALFAEFRNAVENVVQRVAQRRALVLVVEKGQASPTRYYHPALDITDDVLRELDQTSQ